MRSASTRGVMPSCNSTSRLGAEVDLARLLFAFRFANIAAFLAAVPAPEALNAEELWVAGPDGCRCGLPVLLRAGAAIGLARADDRRIAVIRSDTAMTDQHSKIGLFSFK